MKTITFNPCYAGSDLPKLEKSLNASRKAVFAQQKIKELLDDESVIQEAQAMYLAYVPFAKIESYTGIPIKYLRNMANQSGGWKKQRESLQVEIADEIKHRSIEALRSVVGMGVSLVHDSFKGLIAECKRDNRAPSLHEAQVISQIFTHMHKAKIIEEVNADPGSSKTLTPQEILRAFSEDPYFKLAVQAESETNISDETIEVDYSKLDDNDDTDSLANSK